MNQWIWKELSTSQNKTLPAFIGSIFYKDHSLIDNNKFLQSTWQTGDAYARLEFSGKARF